MKILFINNFFSPVGGCERVMWEEACLLREEGHEVQFFATDRRPFYIPNYEYAHFFPPYRELRSIFSFFHPGKIIETFHNQTACKKLSDYLNHLKPDIIHIHNLHYHLTPAILSVCANFNIPTVMTLHDNRMLCPSASYNDKPSFKGFCTTKNPLVCLQSRCKNKSFLETLFSISEHIFNKKIAHYQNIEYFITPSMTLLKLMKKAGLPEKKLVHINNPINSVFHRQTETHKQDDGYFIYVGRLSKEKGVHYLLEALQHLSHIPLKIVGSGPQEGELKALSNTLQLRNVEFLGFQSTENLVPLLQKARASVLPCNWFETFGLSIAESLLLGTPVIASSIGAIPEVLNHGQYGILVPPGDVHNLSKALEDLHQNPEKAYSLGSEGKQRMQAICNGRAHINEVLNLYHKLLR